MDVRADDITIRDAAERGGLATSALRFRAGAVRPGPIYARIWIDQELKRELGF